ncbi:MAG: N-acetylmuramoyl-L-alanine amidase [Terriglobales bacterium]
MQSYRRTIFHRVLLLCVVVCIISAPAWAQEKRLSVYTPETNYSLPVLDRNEVAYIGLLEILEPMGAVSAHQDGTKWKLKFNDREAQFTLLQTKGRVHRRDLELSSPFLIENGRGLVPLHSLAGILSALLSGTPVNFHQAGRRLFVGGVEQRYTANFTKPSPGRLELSFAAPVNPFVATEPGRLRLRFSREPALSKSERLQFPDPLIPSVAYAEENGAAEISVVGSVPLMATFSEDRKTITISAITSPAAASASPAQGQTQPAPAATIVGRTNGSPPPERPRFFVLIDASHGGDEHGATFSDKLVEKDLTLAFARRLHRELDLRGIAARLLRDSDAGIKYEQRANTANTSGAALFVSFHISSNGIGVRVYTSSLAPVAKPAVFLTWESAQSNKLQTSELVAGNIVTELLKRDIPTLSLRASIRPLNNVAMPAVAVEVAPPGHHATDQLESTAYQQSVCGAIASAILSLRPKLQPGDTLH